MRAAEQSYGGLCTDGFAYLLRLDEVDVDHDDDDSAPQQQQQQQQVVVVVADLSRGHMGDTEATAEATEEGTAEATEAKEATEPTQAT